ncbi:hypothetical protein AGDE_12575 [Angomonas deanei]|nr:hypothetical protein AGDE_12575 [Angomonas deanei]|eukprot:EPY24156.1 hypothetical protein AGDE_12575 [Angomonas deanei]
MKMQTRSGDNVENLLVNGWYAYWEEEKGGVTLQDNEFCRLFIGVQFWVTFYSWKHHNGRGSVVWDALRAWYNDRQEMLTREESFTMACCLAVFDSNVSVVSDFSDVISDALAKEIPSEVHPLTRMGLSLLIVKRMFAPCVNSSFCQEWSETQRAHFVAIVYSTSPSLDGLQPLLSTELLNVLMDSPMFFSWMLYLFAEGNRAFDNKDQISTSETVNIFHLASFCRGAFLLEKSPLSEENFNRAVNTVCFFYPSRVDLLCFLIFRFPLCGTEDSVFRVIADRIKTVQAVCEDATLCGLASYVSSLMASSGEQCTSATETGASLKGPLSRPIASLQTKVSLFHSSEYANGETNLVHQPVQLYGLNFTVQHAGCPPALVDGTRATYIPPSTSLAAVYLTTAQLLTAHSTPSAKVESLLARIAVLSNTDDLSTILQSLAMEDAITVDDLSTAWTCLLDRFFAFAVADSTEYLNTCVDAYTTFLNCLEFCAIADSWKWSA